MAHEMACKVMGRLRPTLGKPLPRFIVSVKSPDPSGDIYLGHPHEEGGSKAYPRVTNRQHAYPFDSAQLGILLAMRRELMPKGDEEMIIMPVEE